MTGGTLVAAASYLIQQKYQDYTADQHAVWAELVRRRRPQLDAHACRNTSMDMKLSDCRMTGCRIFTPSPAG